MKYDLEDSFLKAAYDLPKEIGKKIWKCLRNLSSSPGASGLNLERLGGKADRLWSIRVDEKYRAILRRDENVPTLLFVGTHDDAYRFADRAPVRDHARINALGPPPRSEAPLVPPHAVPLRPSASVESRSAKVESRTAKYVPLARYLLNAASKSKTVTITFAEADEMLSASLPASARRHRPWWANDTSGGHVQATAWLSVGWKVAKVSLSEKHVVFEREGK